MAKFFRRGVSKIRFLPTVAASPLVPTRAEITAGTDLSPFVNDIAGFQFNNARIDVPDLASTFTSQIGGPDETGDSTLTMYDDDTSTVVRTTLAKGTSGFLYMMPYGDVATKNAETWPITSTGVNREWSVGNDPARQAVGFAVTAPPNLTGSVPT